MYRTREPHVSSSSCDMHASSSSYDMHVFSSAYVIYIQGINGAMDELNGCIERENRKYDGHFLGCRSQAHTPTIYQKVLSLSLCVCACVYLCTCVCVCVCIYKRFTVYVRARAHTHTHALPRVPQAHNPPLTSGTKRFTTCFFLGSTLLHFFGGMAQAGLSPR